MKQHEERPPESLILSALRVPWVCFTKTKCPYAPTEWGGGFQENHWTYGQKIIDKARADGATVGESVFGVYEGKPRVRGNRIRCSSGITTRVNLLNLRWHAAQRTVRRMSAFGRKRTLTAAS